MIHTDEDIIVCMQTTGGDPHMGWSGTDIRLAIKYTLSCILNV